MDDDLSYPSIDDLAADYEFFGMNISKEGLMEGGVGLAAGAGGILVVQNVMDRIPFFADKPAWRSVTELGVGVLGGWGLYNYNRPAAFALLGGVGGLALASLIQQGMAYVQAQMQAPATTGSGTSGLGQSTGVTPVAPYYDRYKTSVPRSFRSGLQGEMVTRANYFQTHGMAGLGEGEEAAAPSDDDETETDLPDVGTWIG